MRRLAGSGVTVSVEIDTGSPQPVLAVPESAILDTGSRQAVFIDKGQGRFEPRDVKLGHRGAGYVEIREGLGEGEPVVVSANFLIDAESNLKAALKTAPGTQPFMSAASPGVTPWRAAKSMTASTICSVSGRGIKTSGETSKSKPQNS